MQVFCSVINIMQANEMINNPTNYCLIAIKTFVSQKNKIILIRINRNISIKILGKKCKGCILQNGSVI